MNRFSRGAHLRVRRGIYYHHGVYISDDRVIQFGSGVSLRDKHSTRIDAVTLAAAPKAGVAASRPPRSHAAGDGQGLQPQPPGPPR